MSAPDAGRSRAVLDQQMDEKTLQDAVIEMARQRGWLVAHFRPAQTETGWRTPVAADGKGFPDLVLVRERVVFAELKRVKGKVSPEQGRWLEGLLLAGAEICLWTPQHWSDGSIERVLR